MKVCMLAEKLPPEFTGSGRQAVALGKALNESPVRHRMPQNITACY